MLAADAACRRGYRPAAAAGQSRSNAFRKGRSSAFGIGSGGASRGVGPPPDSSARAMYTRRATARRRSAGAMNRSHDEQSGMPRPHAGADTAPTALSKTGVVTQAWDGGDARQPRNGACPPFLPCPLGGKFPGATLVQPSGGWFLKLKQGDSKGDRVKGPNKQRRHARLQLTPSGTLLAVATELNGPVQRIAMQQSS